jgi:ribonucleoside-diphosphate reductase alpha chain
MKKKVKANNLTLEELKFPSYEEVRQDIDRKLGKRPKTPSTITSSTWSEQSIRVLEERYLRKDVEGKITETPDEMCWRVGWEAASGEVRWGGTKKSVEASAVQFCNLILEHKFIPNSPTLMNAGLGNNLQYSGCFVLPVEDSLVGIFDAVKYQALIHQTGGGTGFSFSRLRPKGSIVKSSRGVASGPVSFMRIFDAATNEIKQGGKRRGANMGMIRIDHPDVLEFIHCKEGGEITNFNISLAVTNKFMKAYYEDTDYDLVDPEKKAVVGSLSARTVFEEIVAAAWKTGDPGLIFIDRINEGPANPVPSLGPIESTNPCGEQPLYPYDSCNLGSVFLNYFVKEEEGKMSIDWEDLSRSVRLAVRFLDDIIEVNPFPLPQIRQTVLAIRRIGLGVGGWADALTQLKIKYDSQEALDLAEKVMEFINSEALKMSKELAKTRGPFPLFPVSIYKNEGPRRNSAITTIAPTGSISIIANASSGIEPLFAIAYRHVVKDKSLDRTLSFFNPVFEKTAKEYGIWAEVKEKVAELGVVRGIDEFPQEIKDVVGTAHEMSPEWHIKMQAAFQKYTDNAVSKTINLKKTATQDDVKAAYLLAWETKCKGITVFRDGCKEAQVLNLGLKESEVKTEVLLDKEPTQARPFKVIGATYKLSTPVGTAFVTINEDEKGQPLELFINVGKAGSDVTAIAEALGRTISTALRFKGFLTPKDRAREIALQLGGIGGRRSIGFGPNKIRSLPDAVSVALSNHFGFKLNGSLETLPTVKENLPNGIHTNGHSTNGFSNMKVGADVVAVSLPQGDSTLKVGTDPILASTFKSQETTDGHVVYDSDQPGFLADICPSCGASAFVYEEGCSKCQVCGHSEC